jgi:hypothetical protein
LAAKVAKAHKGSTPVRTAAPLWPPARKKSTFLGCTSNQHQPVDDKKKGATDKEVAVDHDDTDKKLHLSTELEAK